MQSTGPGLKVAIAGAGIAGLALAVRLRDAGCEVDLFEARERAALAEGAFLTLAPNGMNALKPLGVDRQVRDSGIATTAIEIRDERGRRLALIGQADHGKAFGADSVTIRRGTLAAILLERAARMGASMHFGSEVVGVEDGPDGVTVETGTGLHRNYDLLAACDGVRSHVRQLVFPDHPKPRFTGLVGTGGFVEAPDVPPTGGAMRMTFGREAFFGYIRAPGQPVYWFNSYPAQPQALPPGRPEAYARRLRALHSSDPAPNSDILAAVEGIDRDYPIYDIPELPRWHRGNVVLVGDAAHAVGPHAGQGAAMALEDAIVLAACLDAEVHPDAAFSRYEGLRRGRVREVARQTARNASQKRSSGWLSLLVRNLVLPVLIPFGVRAARRFYAFRVDLDPLALPRH